MSAAHTYVGQAHGCGQGERNGKPGANIIKPFTTVSYQFSLKAIVFAPSKSFPFGQLFQGKDRNLPESGAPATRFTWVGSCLTRKPYTMHERLARDKHSSLLSKFITYGCKKFYNVDPWSQCYKTSLESYGLTDIGLA